jgi:type II secretory pathway component PulF
MQLFKYKGYDSDGKRIDGELAAQTIEEVERRVSAQAVTIISIIPAGAAKGASKEPSGSAGRGKSRVSDVDLATILKDLSVMSQTGVPFVEALDAVIETARTPQIEAGLRKFKQEIVGGKSLSAGMRSANSIFPTIVCEMVRIAEEGGRLDRALASASTYVDRAADLRRKVMNALLYPIVLTVISGATVVIMIMYVMPKFADIFTKMGAAVPQSTKTMMAVGVAMKDHPIQVFGGSIAFVLVTRAILKMPKVNKATFLVLLRLPIIGDLLKRLALSRSFSSISTLLNGNVSMLAALEHGANVAGNPVLREALYKAKDMVERGATLSESLQETKKIPPSLVRMVAVGERTGQLAALMANTAGHMEEEVDARLKALISIIEPIMIVAMGVIVGLITMAIIVPMYSIVQNVH